MIISARLEAEVDLAETTLALVGQTVVALPPSGDDTGAPYGSYSSGYTPTTTAPEGIRVYVNGLLIRRRFDSDINA